MAEHAAANSLRFIFFAYKTPKIKHGAVYVPYSRMNPHMAMAMAGKEKKGFWCELNCKKCCCCSFWVGCVCPMGMLYEPVVDTLRL